MNRKKLGIVLVIFLFSIASILAVITQRPNQSQIKAVTELETNKTGSDMVGATNVKSFADIFSNKTQTNKTVNKTSSVRPTATPRPPPYPRITINYTFQKTTSIRGVSAGSNNSFILVSVDIRNYGYKYFDADPNKFRLDPIKPILNISTGNMLNEVVPNNSKSQGDLIFLINNRQRWSTQLSYIGGYTIVYNFGGQTGGSATKAGRVVNVVYPNGE